MHINISNCNKKPSRQRKRLNQEHGSMVPGLSIMPTLVYVAVITPKFLSPDSPLEVLISSSINIATPILQLEKKCCYVSV